MEGAGVAVAAEAVETSLQAGAVYALSVPTLPVKATFSRVFTAGDDTQALKRKNHSIAVAFGRAYIFGGITAELSEDNPDDEKKTTDTKTEELCPPDMHILTLPSFLHSPDIPAYQVIPAIPHTNEGPTPTSRKEAQLLVDGDDLILFGGLDQNNGEIDEAEIWRFNTNEFKWRLCADERTAKLVIPKLRGSQKKGDSPIIKTGEYEYAIEHSADGFGIEMFHRKIPTSASPQEVKTTEWDTQLLPKNPLLPGPGPRQDSAHYFPITIPTTGRTYLLFLSSIGDPDIWALQLHSQSSTGEGTSNSIFPSLSSLKDSLRSVMNQDTGLFSWARVEIQAPKIDDIEAMTSSSSSPTKDRAEKEGATEEKGAGQMAATGGKLLPGKLDGYAVCSLRPGGGGNEIFVQGGVDALGRGSDEGWIVKFE